MRKCIFILCAFLISGISAGAHAASRLEAEMAGLDRVYIAALTTTAEDNRVMAKKVMKALETQWLAFKKNHLHDFADDNSTKVDFAEINQMIDDASRIAGLNGKLSEVHEILDGVRITFFHLRQRNSIDYYLDYLTKFDESMGPIMAIARNKTPDTLSGSNIATLKLQLNDLSQDWNEAIRAHFDSAVFSFTAEMDAKRKQYIIKETESLGRLRQALENENKSAIIQEAASVQDDFKNLYALFGSTEGIK